VKLHIVLSALLLSLPACAQQTAPACPADRPVDEIIAEIHKSQSKKANRNKNPLPSVGCIFGMCADAGRTPPTVPGRPRNPESNPSATPTTSGESTSSGESGNTTRTDSGSTSKTDFERCREAFDRALQAAHDVEVGDQQMDEKHYTPARSRYEEALDLKPGDAAIEVRLGRVLEKLGDPSQATEHYTAAAKLGTPEKWVKEAQSALQRLKGKQ